MSKLFGLLGFPLGHSFSRGYFEKKFQTQGIENCQYRNFEYQDPRQILTEDSLMGFNVTIPHKVAIVELLSQLDPAAAEVGAVNCVKVLNGGALEGYNTDIIGFERSLSSMIGQSSDLRALVLGSGGAARAVEYVLSKLGIEFQKVSRTASAGVIDYHGITREVMFAHRLIINTTPLGMYPNIEASPDIPYQWITEEHFLFDLVYNPAQTEFMRCGRKQSAIVKNGLEMLTLQAEAAWDIWNR